MKIIKPMRLMVMPRPYRWRNGKYLAVTVAALVKHEGDQISVQPEHTLVHDILPELDADEMLDFVMPKPNAEYLVSGMAYTAHQDDKTQCMVRVQVADKRKEAVVFGERYWIDNRISAPQPFDSIALTWSNSYGGPSFPANPLGTGLEAQEVNGTWAIRLPNMESPVDRIRTRGQMAEPWNFGQIRIDWPLRQSKMGSFDEEWVQKVGAGFFDDMDPTLFNAASEDQVWKDRDSLPSQAPFEIWNMHPELHCWSGRLPALQARCFIRRRGAAELLDEVPMRPTTVWFVPHRCNYVLLFHGHIPIYEDDAYDVSAIMAALEHDGQSRPLDHYSQVFRDRSDVKSAVLHALRDEELMPADILAPWFENVSLDQHAMLSKLADQIARHSEAYPAGEFIGPVKPLTLSDLPAIAEQNQRIHDELNREQRDALRKTLDESRQATAGAPDSEDAKLVNRLAAGLDVDMDDGSRKIPVSGPPDISPMLQTVKPLASRQLARRMFEETGGTEAARDMYEFSKRSVRKMYLYSVHYQEGVARVGAHRAVELRERVLTKYRLNKSLANMDLTGADLSNMDLAGADFSESWLEKVDFSNSNLAGATFNETVLARGQFTGTNLAGATLQESNISDAQFERTSFQGARLENLICETKVVFEGCNFTESVFKGFSTEHTEFRQCALTSARLSDVSFTAARFIDCQLDGVKLDKVSLDGALLESVSMTGASILNSASLNTVFRDVRIAESVWAKTVFTEDVVFERCELEGNHLRQCLFREVRFDGVSFEGSVFDQCDFSLARLQKCNLRGITTPQSIFTRANFDMADLSGSNLMQGNFAKASFVGANLMRCNLFRADMSETLMDASTMTANAYVRRTRLAPYRDGAGRMEQLP